MQQLELPGPRGRIPGRTAPNSPYTELWGTSGSSLELTARSRNLVMPCSIWLWKRQEYNRKSYISAPQHNTTGQINKIHLVYLGGAGLTRYNVHVHNTPGDSFLVQIHKLVTTVRYEKPWAEKLETYSSNQAVHPLSSGV